MPRNPQRNYVRVWREHRRMTQSKLAEAIGTTGAVISLIEAGERRLSDKWANLIAPVLGTRPGHLFDTDPNDVDTDILEIWTSIPAERRDQAREVLRTFRGAPKLAPANSVRPKAPARRPRQDTRGD
jgi:transcriptional regulator with XRE-family HTH domain